MEKVKTVDGDTNSNISMDKSIDKSINDKNISEQYKKWCSLIDKMPEKYSPTYKHSSYHYTNFL